MKTLQQIVNNCYSSNGHQFQQSSVFKVENTIKDQILLSFLLFVQSNQIHQYRIYNICECNNRSLPDQRSRLFLIRLNPYRVSTWGPYVNRIEMFVRWIRTRVFHTFHKYTSNIWQKWIGNQPEQGENTIFSSRINGRPGTC